MPKIDLSTITPKEIVPGYPARFVHTQNMTLAYLEVKAGAVLKEHSHPNEQVSHVLEGTFQLTLAGEPIVFEEGTIIVIPSNVPHSGLAITDCKLMDVFSPAREDYKAL
ncbi:MAG: cupin domain-containing protein [Ferruginibacter sp.]